MGWRHEDEERLMEIHADAWLFQSMSLTNEAMGGYVTIASYADEVRAGSEITGGIVCSLLPNTRERRRIARVLADEGLIAIHPDEGWTLYQCPPASKRWLTLGCVEPILRIRPTGFFGGQRVPLPSWKRQRVLERDEYICGICGEEITNHSDAHIDHIFPVSRGGGDNLENLQAAHSTCNLRKGARVGE